MPTESQKKLAATIAKSFGVKPETLIKLITFETAGTWSPTIKNPRSSGRGLIQFLDSTARDLGYSDSQDLVTKNPTVEAQLKGPVLEYFRQFAPYANDDEFIGAVFYPAFRKTPEKVLPLAERKANPGIVTMGDYLRKVKGQIGLGEASGDLQSAELYCPCCGSLLSVAVVENKAKGKT